MSSQNEGMKKPRRKGTPAPDKLHVCEQCGAPYVLIQSLDGLFKTPGAGYGSYKATCNCEPPEISITPPKPIDPDDEVPF